MKVKTKGKSDSPTDSDDADEEANERSYSPKAYSKSPPVSKMKQAPAKKASGALFSKAKATKSSPVGLESNPLQKASKSSSMKFQQKGDSVDLPPSYSKIEGAGLESASAPPPSYTETVGKQGREAAPPPGPPSESAVPPPPPVSSTASSVPPPSPPGPLIIMKGSTSIPSPPPDPALSKSASASLPSKVSSAPLPPSKSASASLPSKSASVPPQSKSASVIPPPPGAPPEVAKEIQSQEELDARYPKIHSSKKVPGKSPDK